MNTKRSGWVGLVVAALASAALAGPVGSKFTYQGQLRNAASPVSGAADFIFTLWDSAAGGAQVGPTLTFDGAGGNPASPIVTAGLFQVELDFGVNAFDGAGRWLGIAVRQPAGVGAYVPLTPRQHLTATPYALGLALPFVGAANTASSAFAISNNADAIRGTSANSAGVYGEQTANLNSAGVWGLASVANGTGVVGIADQGGASYGVYGGALSGFGVYGKSSIGTGVIGMSDSGTGVHGLSTSSVGVSGESESSAGVYGVNSNSASTGNPGVFGQGLAANGNGVVGIANTGAAAYGVYGQADAGRGVFGNSDSGTGVYGASATGSGVTGRNSGTSNVHLAAVSGLSTANNGTGVAGFCSTGTSSFGVYGESSTGYAGMFSGNVFVGGTLSKLAGAFKIDHPLDPANKYLSHSFVESPDMLNIYNGVVVTDAQGYATVALPEWFEALNRDFRYQLTVIDASDEFVQAKVVQKMQGNAFVLRTSRPNTEVSWQVTGVRHDAWANAHRIPVEEVKPEHERGAYLAPELFGASAEQNVHATARRAAAAATSNVQAPAEELPPEKQPTRATSTTLRPRPAPVGEKH